MMDIFLAIKEFGSNTIIKEIKCKSIREAEKVQKGVDINLNHEKFYSEIEIDTKVSQTSQ